MKKIEDETVEMKSNIEEVKIAYRKEVDQLSSELQNATIKYRNFIQLNVKDNLLHDSIKSYILSSFYSTLKNSKEDRKGWMDEQSQLQSKGIV